MFKNFDRRLNDSIQNRVDLRLKIYKEMTKQDPKTIEVKVQ